ncbi:hypothetical protein TPY_3736 [Sulfobacillus acidophilus TPY]|nr:hypothetical protein TPY_3736 [Sulfobacillus acidophilus TPY]
MMKHLNAGDTVRIWTNKWSVVRDMEAFAHSTGHHYLHWEEHPEDADTWWVILEKGEKP